MAQIPTSNIKPRLIYNEINGTSHGTDATIGSGVTMESLRTSSIAYTSGTYTGGTPNVQVTPNRFSEWGGYAHTQDFGNVTYYVRTGTGIGDFCVVNSNDIVAAECTGAANTIFYFILNSTTVEFYMLPDHTNRYSPTQPGAITTLVETATARNTSGSSINFTGNFSSGFTGMKIAELDTGSVSGRQVRMQIEWMQGTGNVFLATISGYTIGDGGAYDTGWRTPSSTKYGVSGGALTFPAAALSTTEADVYHRLTMEVKATGYNTKTLNKFVSHNTASATSDSGFD